MGITNDKELEAAVQRISRDLADIQSYIGDDHHAAARIRFPRGYMRRAAEYRERLWFIGDRVLKKNLAYACMVSDVYRWLINRTDIQFVAQEMIIKEGICLWADIAESIAVEVTTSESICGKNTAFKRRCSRLCKKGVIRGSTEDELCWLWDVRKHQHIFLVTKVEYQQYSPEHYNRAVMACAAFTEDLNDYFDRHPSF